jgi:gluconolactonase
VSRDGSIWFTDPVYGSEYGNRPSPPLLPNQVYRFDPKDGIVRAVADGFGRPNGIAFNEDESVMYIGDTGALVGNGTVNTSGPRKIYAFDVLRRSAEAIEGGFLGNRRVFAMPENQGPDGIKVDVAGNMYSGVRDGVDVWTSGGTLLGGKILLEGGIGNLGFGEPGVLWAMGGNLLWRVDPSPGVVGAGPG